MTTVHLSLEAISSVLSAVAMEQVELIQRGVADGAHVWMVVPSQRSDLRSARWLAYRALPGSGIFDSVSEAVARFGAAWAGVVAATSIERHHGLPGALLARLTDAPVAASTLVAEFAGQGVSRHRLDRAARRAGVQRTKTGFDRGWIWALPEASTKVASLSHKGENYEQPSA